jgi:Holliday junction DNA helicase RuvA
MYDYFEGEITEKGPTSVVLAVGGIAYRFHVSIESSERFAAGSKARVYAQLHVRENEHRLFGFSSREERALFQLLLTVSGVGPSLALKLLSGCPHRELRRAIRTRDLDRIRSVRGVGAKTAQRILVDLAEAIRSVEGEAPEEEAAPRTKAWEDALLALVALGYPRPAAEKALRRAVHDSPHEDTDVQGLVRSALRFL